MEAQAAPTYPPRFLDCLRPVVSDGTFRKDVVVEGVTIVTDEEGAKRAIEVLKQHKDRVHAWDTETADLLVGSSRKARSPVTHGRAVCATCYCGPDVDFGNGPRLFVDNSGPSAGLLRQHFKDYFEDPSCQKVFHNYAFDRHILMREGIRVQGFASDTLHLARLENTSLAGWEGAVQQKLARESNRWSPIDMAPQADYEEMRSFSQLHVPVPAVPPVPPVPASPVPPPTALTPTVRLGTQVLETDLWDSGSSAAVGTTNPDAERDNVLVAAIYAAEEEKRAKAAKAAKAPGAPKSGYGLKFLAGHYGLVDHRLSNFSEVFGLYDRAAEDAHNSIELFPAFVKYSALDAELTYRLHETLRDRLGKQLWVSTVHAIPIEETLASKEAVLDMLHRKPMKLGATAQDRTGKTMNDFVELYMRDLGECLADLSAKGVRICRDQLDAIEAQVEEHADRMHDEFVEKFKRVQGPDGRTWSTPELINPRSSDQMQVLLFGGARSTKDEHVGLQVPFEKECKVGWRPRRNSSLDSSTLAKLGLSPDGEGTLDEQDLLGGGRTTSSSSSGSSSSRSFTLTSLGLSPSKKFKDTTKVKGLPKTSKDVMQSLASTSDGEGDAYPQLLKRGWDPDQARLACQGLWCLSESTRLRRIQTSCLRPLQELSGDTERIHPSWRFDTATGRLVCSMPNLQGLPSTAQDQFGIRSAVKPEAGKKFIIADYAQLELCVLAHMANCPSMLEKLQSGGDYHSEVAAEMFPEIKAALSQGEVVMSPRADMPGVPTVKEAFSGLRTKAKAINFGIVYGKGALTLGEDLNISKDEAQELMDTWFQTKPGVQRWLQSQSRTAKQDKKVYSLLGRARHLPLLSLLHAPSGVYSANFYSAKSQRAAVNFGVQGSAADIVMAAMLQIWKDPVLADRGFEMVMQIHDEFVLEGPEEFADEAKQRVVAIMEDPFKLTSPKFKLRLPLKVDAIVASTFGEKP